MQHDPELIRHVLNHVAGQSDSVATTVIPTVPGHSGDTIQKHVGLLIEHGVLHGSSHVVQGLTGMALYVARNIKCHSGRTAKIENSHSL